MSMTKLSAPSLISILLTLVFSTSGSWAGCLDKAKLTGVNLAGAEFNTKKLPGVIFKDYTYPNSKEMAYIAGQGANIIRLPFRWERLQPSLDGAFDAAELKRIQTTVTQAQANDLCVLLDVHNYAKYYGDAITTPEMQDAFVQLWVKIAQQVNNPDYVALGLMNEPAYIPLASWAALAKRTLAELRASGSTHLVVVGGGGWNGLHSWFNQANGVSNASAFADINDPLKRIAIEVHQYADSYYSGTAQDCHAPDHFTPRFARISQWAKDNGLRLFLGEFGMAATEECLQTLERFLQLMEGTEWLGWTYWAAGSWWGNYPFALNTNSNAPSGQWTLLKNYFYRGEDTSPPRPPTPSSR
jgi:endoglucanase